MCLINGLQLHLSVIVERGNAHMLMLTNKANNIAFYLRIDIKCRKKKGVERGKYFKILSSPSFNILKSFSGHEVT